MRGSPLELGHRKAVSAYADDVTVMVSDALELEAVGTILEEYQECTRAHINRDNSVSLQLGEWRGRSMPASVDFCRWTEGPVKVLGVWFGPDL